MSKQQHQVQLSSEEISKACLERAAVTSPWDALDPAAIEPFRGRALMELLPQKLPYAMIIRPENVAPDRVTRFARVVAVSAGERENVYGEVRKCCCIKVGDTVIVGPHSDWESHDGKYFICDEEDVRGIVSNGKAKRKAA